MKVEVDVPDLCRLHDRRQVLGSDRSPRDHIRVPRLEMDRNRPYVPVFRNRHILQSDHAWWLRLLLTNQTGVEAFVSYVKTELIAFTPIEIVFSSKFGV